jgi:hypothetical protein
MMILVAAEHPDAVDDEGADIGVGPRSATDLFDWQDDE